MVRSIGSLSLVICFVITGMFSLLAVGQASSDRITASIDEAQIQSLSGNVHPLARPEFDQGAVDPDTHLSRLLLLLQPSSVQQSDLDELVEAQQDPQSSHFHNWLTPVQFAARFGATPHDLARISDWLKAHGFTVDEIPVGNQLVIFSGSAGQVEEAFHTSLHYFLIDGVSHIANVQDPQIPKALAAIVTGIVSLHDFRRTAASTARRPLGESLQKTAGDSYMDPSDFAAIYDLDSLYSAGSTGAGVDIAIIGRSNVRLDDVAAFRSALGLYPNSPTIVVDGSNPGLVAGDEEDAILDVEWAGALAPAANVKLVAAASSQTTDGVDLAAQYAVNHATATVLSVGYGSCESDMGKTELAFYNSLWEQAASEGITSIISSGNTGASCGSSASITGNPVGVNGLCTSPYSTCVGGTEFTESIHPQPFRTTVNKGDSATGYVPEQVWNETGDWDAPAVLASGGGISTVYALPSWQQGLIDTHASQGMRTVPDVALPAAMNNGLVTYQNGSWWLSGGTSAAASSFAAIIALAAQSSSGKGLGNVNPTIYRLLDGATSPFHTTAEGNNSVPGVLGFTASGAPYNFATGLGSVDGSLFVSKLSAGFVSENNALATQRPPAVSSASNSPLAGNEGSAPGSFSGSSGIKLTAASSELVLTQGSSMSDTFTLSAVGSFQGPVSLEVSGLPSGVVASWSLNPVILRSSGTAIVTLTLAGAASAPTTSDQMFVVTATGKRVLSQFPTGSRRNLENISRLGSLGSLADVTANSVCEIQVLQAPSAQIQLSNSTLIMQATGTASLTILVMQTGGLNSSEDVSVGPPPAGVGLALSEPTQNGTGGTSTVLTLAGSTFAHAGSYTIPINVTLTDSTGSAITSSTSMTLNLD